MKTQHTFDYLDISYKFSSASDYNEEYHLEIFGTNDDNRVFIGKAKVELYLLGLAEGHKYKPVVHLC